MERKALRMCLSKNFLGSEVCLHLRGWLIVQWHMLLAAYECTSQKQSSVKCCRCTLSKDSTVGMKGSGCSYMVHLTNIVLMLGVQNKRWAWNEDSNPYSLWLGGRLWWCKSSSDAASHANIPNPDLVCQQLGTYNSSYVPRDPSRNRFCLSPLLCDSDTGAMYYALNAHELYAAQSAKIQLELSQKAPQASNAGHIPAAFSRPGWGFQKISQELTQ